MKSSSNNYYNLSVESNQHKFALFVHIYMLESIWIMIHKRKDLLYRAWVKLKMLQWENWAILAFGCIVIDPWFFRDWSLLFLIFRDRSLVLRGWILSASDPQGSIFIAFDLQRSIFGSSGIDPFFFWSLGIDPYCLMCRKYTNRIFQLVRITFKTPMMPKIDFFLLQKSY